MPVLKEVERLKVDPRIKGEKKTKEGDNKEAESLKAKVKELTDKAEKLETEKGDAQKKVESYEMKQAQETQVKLVEKYMKELDVPEDKVAPKMKAMWAAEC